MLDCESAYRQQPRIQEFENLLKSYFEKCYEKDDDVSMNGGLMDEAVKMIDNLFTDYTDRLDKIYEDNIDAIPTNLVDWVRQTVSSIERVYQRNQSFRVTGDVDPDTGYPTMITYSTDFFKTLLIAQTYETFANKSLMYFGPLDRSVRQVMPYNFWGGKYDQQYEEYKGQIALSDENRAKVFLQANEDWFDNYLRELYSQYEAQESICGAFGGSNANDYHPERHLPRFFQDLFADYVRRVQNQTKDEYISRDAFQYWAFHLICRLNALYTDELAKVTSSPHYDKLSESACHFFFLDCSLSVIIALLHNYHVDSAAIRAMQQSDAAVGRKKAASSSSLDVIEVASKKTTEQDNASDIDYIPNSCIDIDEPEDAESDSDSGETRLQKLFKNKAHYPIVVDFIRERIRDGWHSFELTYFQALYESGLTLRFLPGDIFPDFPELRAHAQQYSKYVGDGSIFKKPGKRGGPNKFRVDIEEHKRELLELVNSVDNNQ